MVTETVRTSPCPRVAVADATGIAEAARILRDGGLVAFPTETVYGLGALAANGRAIARVFEAKGRPRFNPLIVHVADHGSAERVGRLGPMARRAADAFWPGALTLVVQRRNDAAVDLLATAGLDTVAIRLPDHSLARTMITEAGGPVVAPSANRSGAVSPTLAEHVTASLGDAVDLVLDGGPCRVGVESTVVDVTGSRPVLLRPGGIDAETLETVLGPLASPEPGGAPRSPGMLARHYAPSCPVRLDAREARPGEALLAFGPDAPAAEVARNLSPAGDLVEAAANLFRMLHELQELAPDGIAVMPIPDTGLGRAINDRLHRAATPP